MLEPCHTVTFELKGVDVTMDSMEMVEAPVVQALINVKRVKEIVIVMLTAKVILGVVKAVEMMTIVILALDFL